MGPAGPSAHSATRWFIAERDYRFRTAGDRKITSRAWCQVSRAYSTAVCLKKRNGSRWIKQWSKPPFCWGFKHVHNLFPATSDNLFQDVCCSSECGVCGGDKCSWRPGGRSILRACVMAVLWELVAPPWELNLPCLLGYGASTTAAGYGSIPINTIFRGMNIHLPAILMFTRGTRFWHTAILWYMMYPFTSLRSFALHWTCTSKLELGDLQNSSSWLLFRDGISCWIRYA